MSKRGTGSVFKRLFALFLAMVIVVYVVLATVFVNYVLQQRELENKGHLSSLENSASVFAQELNAVYNVETQLFNDVRVARLAHGLYDDEYEKTMLILDLLSSIQSTQSINSIISDIIITCPAEQIELSAVNGYHRKVYDTSYFSTSRSTGSSPLVIHDEHLEMNIAYPIKNTGDEDYIPDYEIRILLSLTHIDGFLDTFRNQALEGAFWAFQNREGAMQPVSEDQENNGHLIHWNREWEEAGSPGFYNQISRCEMGEFWFASQQVQGYNLCLVTYRDTNIMAWNIGNEIIYIGIAIVLMGVLFGFFVYRANNSVNKPIRKIMDAFQKLSDGDLDIRIFHRANDEFGYIYDAFNDTVGHIKGLIDNITEQKTLLQKAELMQLQSQINPHFLYNSFYNLKFLAHDENFEQIEVFVTALAKYYRFINKETHLDVALSSEVAHMENYIEIQQMRFGDKINVELAPLPEEVRDFRVPKLILQPIIENAYNYGLRDTLADGLLRIRYKTQGKYLYISIEDNGGAMTEEKLAAMNRQIHTYEGDAINHALTNIQRRLMLAYGEHCGLKLGIGRYGGLEVTLCMDTEVALENPG